MVILYSLVAHSLSVTHHTVIVDQLQLVVWQYVSPLIHYVQCHPSSGEAGLSARPAPTHGKEGSNVELLLAKSRAGAGEEDSEGKGQGVVLYGPAEPSHSCWMLS